MLDLMHLPTPTTQKGLVTMPEPTAQTCTAETLFEENASLTEQVAGLQERNIDLLDILLNAGERIQGAATLAEAKRIIAEQVLRATDYERWVAQQ